MSITDYVGNTPIVKLNNIVDKNSAAVWAKLENLNPAGSLKERICKSIIEDAESKGLISPGKTTIVEASSGNTGISMAVYCKIKGYDLIIVMPEYVNMERKQIINVYGGKVMFSEASGRMGGALKMANDLVRDNENYFLLDQFENSLNPTTHQNQTAVEIADQIEGNLDAFVMGVGTGGTISGVASFLKEKYPNIMIIAVEPEESAVLSGKKPGEHKIYGIGAGFIPKILDLNIVDEIYTVKSDDAIEYTKKLSKDEGILAGISSGASCLASANIAKQMGKGKQIVTIFCDTGERYLSMNIYN